MSNNKSNDESLEKFENSDIVVKNENKVEYQSINAFLTIILFLVACGGLVISILFFFKKYEKIAVNSINTTKIDTNEFSSFGQLTTTTLKTDTFNVNNLNINDMKLKSSFINNLNVSKVNSTDMTLFENDINNKVIVNNTTTKKQFTNIPTKYGFICFKFDCQNIDVFNCKVEEYLVNPNSGQRIYLNYQNQIYHFRNTLPPCVLWDTISDQIVNPLCGSSCQETCELMKINSFSYATNSLLKQSINNKVIINKKDTDIIDMELEMINNNNCFIFGNGLVKNDILNKDSSKVLHTIYFENTLEDIPFVEAYFESVSGYSNIYNKLSSKEWKSKYVNLIDKDKYVYCLYNNLDSLLYSEDVLTGTTRFNLGINVIEITNTYFKIEISTNYGYKIPNGYTIKYNIYEYIKL